MTEAKTPPPLPDRLCTGPRSPHHLAAVFEHDVGIRFSDKERSDVAEYCIKSATLMPSADFAG